MTTTPYAHDTIDERGIIVIGNLLAQRSSDSIRCRSASEMQGELFTACGVALSAQRTTSQQDTQESGSGTTIRAEARGKCICQHPRSMPCPSYNQNSKTRPAFNLEIGSLSSMMDAVYSCPICCPLRHIIKQSVPVVHHIYSREYPKVLLCSPAWQRPSITINFPPIILGLRFAVPLSRNR